MMDLDFDSLRPKSICTNRWNNNSQHHHGTHTRKITRPNAIKMFGAAIYPWSLTTIDFSVIVENEMYRSVCDDDSDVRC